MRRLLTILGLVLCLTTTATAQSYTQHLQEKKQGQGNVTVNQSKEIDELVNSTNVSARSQEPADNKKTAEHNQQQIKNNPTPQHNNDSAKTQHKEHESTVATRHEQATNSRNNNTTHESHKNEQTTETEKEEPYVDTSKKVMRRSYKVNGYRVQVFAGGNSRNDKQKAQAAGNAVKHAMPEQPVYVHFYSPRWICRVGNFKSYEEAKRVLQQVQKMGYKQACIVSGKITVAY